MRILFSTPNSLNLFDFQSGLRTILADEPREFYGISGDSSRLVLSHSRIDCESLRAHQDYLQSPQGLLSFTGGQGRFYGPPALLQPHQIECFEDSVLCANAGRNCITIFDSRLCPRDIYPTTARWDIAPGEHENSHFNSVHVAGGCVYVVAHNHHRDSAVWVFEWPGFALVEVIPTRSQWAHNVWVIDDDLIVCNSRAGALYSVNAKQDIWSVAGGGYITRGLAANESYLLVGLSALASRGDRKNSDSGFVVLDRKTLQTLDTFIFPDMGAVHEIRLLDEIDLCHGGTPLRLPDLFSQSGASCSS